ncbi:hypothetical protein OBBRIDRAFT_727398, partial [Obba rivulosa]
RAKEFIAKHEATVSETLGKQRDEMIYLGLLATAPEKQGRGYASTLVRVVTAIADTQGRSTWLTSSNIDNTGFYESLGFEAISEFPVGENDPTWDKLPVIVRLVCCILFVNQIYSC